MTTSNTDTSNADKPNTDTSNTDTATDTDASNTDIDTDTVLVTGGSGYLGTRLITDLLLAGTPVRTTVRSLDREAAVREAVRRGGADDSELSFAVASLTDDDGWADAAAGTAGIYHLASPMIHSQDPDEVVPPARDGALRLLRAAVRAGVPRVVLTSSFAAIGYSPKPVREADGAREYDESDWTAPDTAGLPAYPLSKAVAERAAWDFMKTEGGDTELVVVNPTWIAGPTLTSDARSSLQIFTAMLGGQMSLAPRQRFGIADVRDVSAAHIAAMTTPGAAGKRYLVLADGPTVSWLGIADILRARFGALASQAPTEEVPGDELAPLVIHNERSKAELGMTYRPAEQTIADTVQSMLQLGMLG